VRTLCKTNITKAERFIFIGDLKEAQGAVAVAVSSLDKAAEEGIIHPNNAARRKSRLMKKFNEMRAQAPAPVETKPKAPEAKKAEPKVAEAEAEAKPEAKAKAKAAKTKAKATKPKAKVAKPKAKATKPKAKKAKTKKEAAPENLTPED
jgi:ribosomal protein S20